MRKNAEKEDALFDGGVYTMTSVNTFSPAMLFAEYIQDNHLGKIIGEIPGESPDGCGEIAVFKTPNAKIYFQVSSKNFSGRIPAAP